MCPVMSWLLCLCLWVSMSALQLCQATFYDTIQQHPGLRPGRTTVHMIGEPPLVPKGLHPRSTLDCQTFLQHLHVLRLTTSSSAGPLCSGLDTVATFSTEETDKTCLRSPPLAITDDIHATLLPLELIYAAVPVKNCTE